MHGIQLIQDLAAVMVVAAATTLLCRRLNQPVVIGYLVAGVLIGPYTPPFAFVHNLDSIQTMAELGLVFLMFHLGLEFNLPKLRKVGASAALAALLEVVGMFAIGFGLGAAFGWSRMDGIFLGAILSISSTTIIIKVFMDLNMTKEHFAQAVFGILILEDVAAVLILSVLSGLAGSGGLEAGRAAMATLKIIFFVIIFLTLGLSLVPRLVHWTARFGAKEMTGIVVLGLCLSGALLAYWFGFSVALGGFLMGAVVAASTEIDAIEEWFAPVRDMFSAIFFVSAGMLIQPQLLWQHKGAIAVVVAATLVGKILSGTAGAALAGFPLKTSAKIGFSLAQIGEFSFVIASLGASTGVASEFLYPMAVTVSSLTTFCTPYLIRHSDRMVEGMLSVAPAGFTDALQRYQARKAKRQEAVKGPVTIIFSKYLIRLVVYIALFISAAAGLEWLSQRLLHPEWSMEPRNPLAVFAPWLAGGLLAAPLMALIGKYASHSILLFSTLSSRSPVLRYFNIRAFYATVFTGLCTLIGLAFLRQAAPYAPGPEVVAGLGLLMFLTMLALNHRLGRVTEWVESALDEVLGLATSEPTRQAVLRSAGKDSIFEEITRQVAVREGSPAARRTIRDLRIRELTGASVVAVYRQGKHIANPSPDTEILPEDILIFLGDAQECDKAQALLEKDA